jgi:uncharacterized protein (TIGR00369 family)
MSMAGPSPRLDELIVLMPHAVELGITLRHATSDEVRGDLDWAADRCTVAGALHGGVLMALADSVGAVCAYLNLPAGADTSTVESKTNFFRAIRSGKVCATSRPLHVGRSFIAVQTELADERGTLVAQTIQTQAVLHPTS